MSTINMQSFARSVGVTMSLPAGKTIFNEGDPGDCLYIVQSGKIEMSIKGRVTATIGANAVVGFMSVIDGGARNATAKAVEDSEVSLIDARKFRFMLDEVPNFNGYILDEMARVIRGIV